MRCPGAGRRGQARLVWLRGISGPQGPRQGHRRSRAGPARSSSSCHPGAETGRPWRPGWGAPSSRAHPPLHEATQRLTAGDVQQLAVDRRDPQVGGAGVEDDREALRGRPDADLPVVLRLRGGGVRQGHGHGRPCLACGPDSAREAQAGGRTPGLCSRPSAAHGPHAPGRCGSCLTTRGWGTTSPCERGDQRSQRLS